MHNNHYIYTGPPSPHAQYGRAIRDEEAAKERDPEEGPSDARAGRARHYGLRGPVPPQPLGRQALFLVPGRREPLPHHGIRARRRHDGSADQDGYLRGGDGALLHCGDDPRHRFHSQAQLHSPRHQARQLVAR